MKRNFVLNKIKKILIPWESSILDKKCANEILTMLEELGIICPPEVKVDEYTFLTDDGKTETIDITEMKWE